MLQKYHPNPLSHFLALHNSQATHHNVVDAHTLASTIQFQHHQQQQQQHQQNILANHHHQQNHSTAIELAAQHLNSHNSTLTATQRDHHHHQQQQQHQTHLLQQHLPQNPRNLQNHQHSQHHHHHNHAQQLIEAAAVAATANTTLDAGKSFTIAAILGLQKSAMENTRKEYSNNVINLSLNNHLHQNQHHHHQHQQQAQQPDINSNSQQPPTNNNNNSTPPPTSLEINDDDDEPHHKHQPSQNRRDSLSSNNSNNNNNNNNNRDVSNMNTNKSNICHSFSNNNNISNSNSSNNNNMNTTNNSVNSFNCDTNSHHTTAVSAATVLMNRYLPSAMVNVPAGSNTGVASTPSLVSFASSPVMTHQQHVRANSFVAAAAAAAAAAAVNGAPSALQSLQQLHQQHAHQTSLSFQRDKLKSDHNSKKSSLKNKRVRTIFTPEQLERLEAEFERQQYMVGPERLYLAHTLQLTEAQVKVWFQNRRIKWRKHHLEITQQRLALLRQTQIAANPNGSAETDTINIDTNDEECDDIKREELRELSESRQDTESELSICNDSMDAESLLEGDDET